MALNEYGILIRKIRKEKDETLVTMSEKLNVSVAFLSAMEVGKKTIPTNYVTKISSTYDLNSAQEKELANAIDISNKKISINLENLDKDKTDVSLAFARTINTASQKKLEELRKLLEEDE